MLDWTDRHCRFFMRQISRATLLYTEMITTGALLHAARVTGANASGTAVVISPDDAGKYISSYAAYLADQGAD